jgi:GNAT superfamily N-acetyltransferase
MWLVGRDANGLLQLDLGEAFDEPSGELRRLWVGLDSPTSGQRRLRSHSSPDSPSHAPPLARLRIALPEELPTLLAFGYDAWGQGRPMQSFIASYDQSRDHLRGTRYLLETLDGELLCDLNALRFGGGAIGIASVATAPEQRRKGYASLLLRAVLALLDLERPGRRFLLFSEVPPAIYERVGFGVLPAEHQHHLPAVAMATGSAPLTPAEAALLLTYF